MKREQNIYYKFLKYFFYLENDELDSVRVLAEKFGTTRTKMTTTMKYFAGFDYIYSSMSLKWKANVNKMNFDRNLNFWEDENWYYIRTTNWTMDLNKKLTDPILNEYNMIEEGWTTNIEDVIFVSFMVLVEYNVATNSRLKLVDNILWMCTDGYSKSSIEAAFKVSYSQNQNYIKFGGK